MSIKNRINRIIKEGKRRAVVAARRRAGVYMLERPRARMRDKRRMNDGTLR